MTETVTDHDELRPDEPEKGATDTAGTPAPGDGERAAGSPAVAEARDTQASPEALVETEEGQAPERGDNDLRVVELEAELEALNDRHLRLAAEFNNYRRRTEHERLVAWDRAQADLVGRLLDVLDDLQRVSELDAEQTTLEGLMEGIDLVERKFMRTLEDAGIETIDPVGATFDPETMEAMMRLPAEGEGDDDRVAQVFQKGYALRGQLVRPARVSVHKHG